MNHNIQNKKELLTKQKKSRQRQVPYIKQMKQEYGMVLKMHKKIRQKKIINKTVIRIKIKIGSSVYMKTIKNNSEYEIYEDQLNQYNNRNKSKVIGKPQQWNLIQSRLINAKANKPRQQQRIVIDADGDSAESRAISRKGVSNDKIGSQSPNLYNQQYVVQIQKTPASSKSPQQLQSQIKNMRQMLINLNNEVNAKLNKYELHQYVPKGMAIVNEPEKQEALLMAQIQTNAKVIQALQKEIKEIKQRDRELEEKDYLIDLQIAAGEIMRNIRGTRKQKHNGKVIVEKLDGRLLQLQEQALQNQFRAVKHLKHNILHYYKKQVQQTQTLQQLSIQQSQLQQKLNKLDQKYKKLVTLAQQQNIAVKVNINYIQNKKIYDDKLKKVDLAKKAVDVVKKAKDIQCVKVNMECQRIKRDIGQVNARIQDFSNWDHKVSQNIQQDLGKSRRGNMLAKMLQKFGQATSQSPQKSPNILQSLPMIPSPNRYQTASYRPQYNTIDIQRSLRIKNQSKRKLEQYNDKNSRSIRFEDDESRMVKQYRIKPSLHRKKNSEGSKLSQSKGNSNKQKKENEDIVEDLLLAEGDHK